MLQLGRSDLLVVKDVSNPGHTFFMLCGTKLLFHQYILPLKLMLFKSSLTSITLDG